MCVENWWRPRYTLVQDIPVRAIRYLRRVLVSRVVKDNTLWEMGGFILERVVLGTVIGLHIRLSKPFQIKGNEEICSY